MGETDLEFTIDTLPVVACVVSLEPHGLRVVHANARFARLVGDVRQQLSDSPLTAHLPMSANGKLYERLRCSVRTEVGHVEFDTSVRLREGERHWRVSVSALPTSSSGIFRRRGHDQVLMVATDISRLVSRQDSLREQTQRFRVLALRDELTGLANRRAFTMAAKPELERARRKGIPLSMLAFDVDDLKGINDTFGHAAGDLALRSVARVAKAELRDKDLVARLGGDEFAALLPQVDAAQARTIAERLRAAALSSVPGTSLPGVGLSLGIASAHDVRDIAEPERAIERMQELADQELYREKASRVRRTSTIPREMVARLLERD